jgi:hypothetical protein
VSDKSKPTDESKEIAACMNCGSKDITGIVAATYIRYEGPKRISQRHRCRECEYFGIPMLFGSEEERLEYAEFRKTRKHDLPSVFEAPPDKIEKDAKSSKQLSLGAGFAFFIIGLLYMFQHELLIGFMFYGASFFFLVLAIGYARKKC